MKQWNYDNATQPHVADAPATNNKNTYLFLSVDKISIEGYFCINHGNNNKTHRARTHTKKTNKQVSFHSQAVFFCVFLFCSVMSAIGRSHGYLNVNILHAKYFYRNFLRHTEGSYLEYFCLRVFRVVNNVVTLAISYSHYRNWHVLQW